MNRRRHYGGSAPPNITSPSQLRVTGETPTQTRQRDFGMPTSACDKRGTWAAVIYALHSPHPLLS